MAIYVFIISFSAGSKNRVNKLNMRDASTDLAHVILAYSGPRRFDRTGWSDHRLDHWVLDVLVRGRQLQRVGAGEPFWRESGVLALYAPGTRYRELEAAGQTLAEAFVVFSVAGAVARLLEGLTGRRGYCYIEDPQDAAGAMLQQLGRRYRTGGAGSELTVAGLMLQVLGAVVAARRTAAARHRIMPAAGPGIRLVDRVADYLDTHLDSRVRTSDLAAAVGMSVSAFAHAYRAEAGEPPYQAVLRSKMAAAKRLLLQDGLTVKEAAAALGFSTPFNFSRTFKRMVGCSPSGYVIRHAR
jgi:AraC-like DNA-binding protein